MANGVESVKKDCSEKFGAGKNSAATITSIEPTTIAHDTNFERKWPTKRKIDHDKDAEVSKKLVKKLEHGKHNLAEVSSATATRSAGYTLRSGVSKKTFDINLDFGNTMSHNNNIQVADGNGILSTCKFYSKSNNLNISSAESIKKPKLSNSLDNGVKTKSNTSILNKTWNMRKQTILRSRSSKNYSNATVEQAQTNVKSTSSDKKYLAIVKKCNQTKSLGVASMYGYTGTHLVKNTLKTQPGNKFSKKELATKTHSKAFNDDRIKRNLPAQTKKTSTQAAPKTKSLPDCNRNGQGLQVKKSTTLKTKYSATKNELKTMNCKHNSHLKLKLTPKKRPAKKQKEITAKKKQKDISDMKIQKEITAKKKQKEITDKKKQKELADKKIQKEIATKKKKVSKESVTSKKSVVDIRKFRIGIPNKTQNGSAQKPNNALEQKKTTDSRAAKTLIKKECREQDDNVNSVITSPGLLSSPSSSRSSRAHKRLMNNGWRWMGKPINRYVQPLVGGSPVHHKCYVGMVNSDGDVINTGDCVLVKSGTRKCDVPYVARIAALYNDPDTGSMMVYLLWYYSPENVDGCHVYKYQKNELFGSRHADENPVACIDERCYVVTFAEYCRYMSRVRRAELNRPELRIVPRIRYHRQALIPQPDTDPELVFFSRAVYDVKLKRLVKNPFKTDDGIVTRRQTRNMSTLLSQLSARSR